MIPLLRYPYEYMAFCINTARPYSYWNAGGGRWVHNSCGYAQCETHDNDRGTVSRNHCKHDGDVAAVWTWVLTDIKFDME